MLLKRVVFKVVIFQGKFITGLISLEHRGKFKK